MGIGPRWSSGGKTTPPNPNPYRFEIKNVDQVGKFFVALVHYPGCTTFKGDKLLLLDPTWDRGSVVLDPHILHDGHVIARFRPTPLGRHLAIMCAHALSIP